MTTETKKTDEEEIERLYTIPLSRAWVAPKYRRSVRAVHMIREFAEKHLKSSEIIISADLNELIWTRGIQNPPRKVSVKMTKDKDGVVVVSLPSGGPEKS